MGEDIVCGEDLARCRLQVPEIGVPFAIGAPQDVTDPQTLYLDAASEQVFRKYEQRWSIACASDVSGTPTVWLMSARDAHKTAVAVGSVLKIESDRFLHLVVCCALITWQVSGSE